jgi:hypothetical protein
MALKGVKPEVVKPQKPKILISGPAGSRKSSFALNAQMPFYIDTEAGITREQYMKKLALSGGLYFGPMEGSQDFSEITAQVKELATTKNPYKWIIVDSLTKPYRIEMFAAEDRGVSSEFKKSQKEAEKGARKLMGWLMRPDLDLSVMMICHTKDKWAKDDKGVLVKEGSVWDGPEKLDYDLDLWLETQFSGPDVYAVVKKSRVEGFVTGAKMAFDFETFKRMYGAAVIDRPIQPITLATAEQVTQLNHLVEVLKVPQEDLDKWLLKAQATEIEDLSSDNADKLIKFLKEKIEGKEVKK